MPPKKPEPVKKDTKKDVKKKDDKKQEQVIEPVRELRYQQMPENIKSNLEHYKNITKQKTGLKVQDIVESILKGIQKQKSTESSDLKRLIEEEQISLIFRNVREGAIQKKMQACTKLEKVEQRFQLQLKKLTIISQISKHPPLSKFQFQSSLDPERLKHLFYLVKFQQLFNSKQKYRKFSFIDRNITEAIPIKKFSKILNAYLQNNCQYFRSKIAEQKEKELIALYYQNPPGRNIYYTDVTKLKQGGRFGYWEEQVEKKGGLASRTRFMYPADNALLIQKIRKIGQETKKQVKVIRKESELEVKNHQKEQRQFIVTIKDMKVKVRNTPKVQIILEKDKIEEQKIQDKVEEAPPVVKQIPKASPKKPDVKKVDAKSLKKGQKPPPEPQPEPVVEVVEPLEPPPPPKPIEYTQSLVFNSPLFKYKIGQTNFISITPNNKFGQTHRQYGPNGQIIKHCRDKSVTIFYSNGDTSVFKSSSWTKIVNNEKLIDSQSPKKLNTKRLNNESSTITIRQDSTIFIEQKSIKTIIYPDQTRYKINSNNNTVTICHPQYPTVRIRYDPHRMRSNNVIGKGTSYAYLGFQNLFERSCDGHIFQLFQNQFSYFRYTEKVLEHELQEPKLYQISLIHFREGSILKCQNKQILFLSAQDLHKLNLINSNEHWLQLFTTPEHRKQGIYTINLSEGTIKTTDNQGNYFQLNLMEPSIIKTAVSLNIDNKKQEQPKYQNEYYVDKQNYFLPTPSNFIEPRLFVMDGSQVVQFLNENVADHEINISQKYGYQVMREDFDDNKQHIQIYRKQKGDQKLETVVPLHSLKLDLDNKLPKILEEHTSTFIATYIPEVPQYQSRSFIKYKTENNYQDYFQMVEKYNKSQQIKHERREKTYKVLSRGDLI